MTQDLDDIPDDGLSPKQRAFVLAWFRINAENDQAGIKESERVLANRAAAEAGYAPTADNHGWNLTHNPKIALAIHNIGHIGMVRLRQKAIRILDWALDNASPTNAAGLLKLAFEHGAHGTHEKGVNVNVENKITVTGDALENELAAALARRGVTYVNGGKLEPMPAIIDARATDVTVQPDLKEGSTQTAPNPEQPRKKRKYKPRKVTLTPPLYKPMTGKRAAAGRPSNAERYKFTFEEDL